MINKKRRFKHNQGGCQRKPAVFAAFFAIAAIFLLLGPGLVLAQGANNLWGGQAGNFQAATGLGSDDPRIIIARIIQILLGFLGIIAVLLIMYGGWLWTMSKGDPHELDRAKKVLRDAAIGLAIILMSFAIATFILNSLYQATGGGQVTNPPYSNSQGLAVLGNCTVESVYPEPEQREVPRNTSIIVTFREAINPATIIDGANPGHIITDGRIQIYKNTDPGNPITDVHVATNNNRTFVFTPATYLGSPSEYLWYTVYLSNLIQKSDGTPVFNSCSTDFLRWQFEVSNRIDLTPPQVLSAGVFPAPDDAQDTVVAATGQAAVGTITIVNNSQIFSYSPAAFTGVNGSFPATVAIDPYCQESGDFRVTIGANGTSAQLSRNNGTVLLGSATVSSNSGVVAFPNYLTLTLNNYPTDWFAAGNVWNISGVTAERKADTITVGNITYVFGSDIAIGAAANATANNIANALASHPDVAGTAAGAQVTVTARVAGVAGNNIALAASKAAALTIAPMSGGTDTGENVTINGKRDKPRNAVIQINFNEAMNPLTMSGNANDVSNYIRVVNIAAPAVPLTGKFMVSNQYRTVEFISDNLCGVNGCGQEIFCLPGNSNLRVELIAASLIACANNNDCAARSPYNTCAVYCQDTSNNNYPTAGAMNGIMDVALNSLDGNRDNNADGPASFYNENLANTANGDNFQWSFWINNNIDSSAPLISNLTPLNNAADVSTADPILINFNKVMMSSSLSTGSIEATNGQTSVTHKLINLWSLSNYGTGYWVAGNNMQIPPPDNEPDWTQAELRHTLLGSGTSYRAQVGSGVKDIYQNCYKPSSGPGCVANNLNPSCCGSGTGVAPTNSLTNGNCP